MRRASFLLLIALAAGCQSVPVQQPPVFANSAVADALVSAGFEIDPVEKHASFGRVHLVARSGDAWQGVADLDWEGTAASASCGVR